VLRLALRVLGSAVGGGEGCSRRVQV
jgi:hypothetical protein